MTARFIDFGMAAQYFRGKSVAIVGSAPSVLDNEQGFIDSHDVVVRVNNYKTGPISGFRCDVHYSFFGNSIRKLQYELIRDGVKLCMCKCPDAKPLVSDWHERNNKQVGIDFRYIYTLRKNFWFCDTFVPDNNHFLQTFELLGRHIPTTGFAAIFDILQCGPKQVYLTGFDFFHSHIHNIDEAWKPGDPNDPIGHRPEFERNWIAHNREIYPFKFDGRMNRMIEIAYE